MPAYLPLLLLLGVTIAVIMGGFLLVRGLLERRRRHLDRRLRGGIPEEPGGLVLEGAGAKPPETWAGRIDQAFDQLVRRTGLGWTAGQVLGVMAFLGVTLAGALLLWRDETWPAGLGLVLGMGLPLAVLLFLQARRRRQLQDQLPDVFLLLARSLRAGQNLEHALATVTQYGTKPLANEFRRAVEQIELGLTVPAALQGMAQRLRLPDFDVFVTAVTLHRTLGGNLALLLEKVATSTRDRNLFRGYFRASTALSRLTAFCVAAAAPVLFVAYSFWQPDFVARFGASAAGVQTLAIALGLELIGIVWLCLLLRTDY